MACFESSRHNDYLRLISAAFNSAIKGKEPATVNGIGLRATRLLPDYTMPYGALPSAACTVVPAVPGAAARGAGGGPRGMALRRCSALHGVVPPRSQSNMDNHANRKPSEIQEKPGNFVKKNTELRMFQSSTAIKTALTKNLCSGVQDSQYNFTPKKVLVYLKKNTSSATHIKQTFWPLIGYGNTAGPGVCVLRTSPKWLCVSGKWQ